MVLTPEREQKKAHALTLKKQGWTQRAIAAEIDIPRRTIRDWLGGNIELLNNARKGGKGDNHKYNIIAQKPNFLSFCGNIENFQPENNVKFPLIIADPPWNISSPIGAFTFKDKNGQKHTPMKCVFGEWDFQGDDEAYLQNINTWLKALYNLASDNSYCWFWCSYRYLSHINNIAKGAGWEQKGWYVWAKTNVPPLLATINGTLLSSLEPCLIFRKGTGGLKTNKTGHPNYKELPMVPTSQRLPDSENLCAKPQAILSDIIEWCTEPGEWVLDAFSGTGSTTLATLAKKRNCYAVDNDKRQVTLLNLYIEETYGIHP